MSTPSVRALTIGIAAGIAACPLLLSPAQAQQASASRNCARVAVTRNFGTVRAKSIVTHRVSCRRGRRVVRSFLTQEIGSSGATMADGFACYYRTDRRVWCSRAGRRVRFTVVLPRDTARSSVPPRDVAFSTPDHNIGCWISHDLDTGKMDAAHCFAQEHKWREKKRDCGDISNFEELLVGRRSRRGVRHTICLGGVPWNIDFTKYPNPLQAPALRRGQSKHVGPFRCRGRTRSRIRCANDLGHGFTIGRRAFRLF